MKAAGLLMIFVWFGVCAVARAGEPYLTATYEPTVEGYLLRFVVHNTLPDNIDALRVSTADAAHPYGPDGWHIYQDLRQVEWTPLDLEHQIPPGHDLGGFGFTASSAPGSLGWWVGSRYGHTGSVTPTLIPEPSSLAVLAAGMMGLGGVVMRRRR